MKACPECNNPIMGRADKKFCSDLCRNAYNNRANADQTAVVKNTNNALRKNRRILEGLCTEDKAKVSKGALAKQGFDFGLITSIRTTQKGSTYKFVYEYGYLELENEAYLIVKDNRNG
jgi:predicted nucleic acid-binding Zn ribbon protein